MPIPNIANGLIPIVSNNLPATGPNAPMTNAPGNSNNPESKKPLRFLNIMEVKSFLRINSSSQSY